MVAWGTSIERRLRGPWSNPERLPWEVLSLADIVISPLDPLGDDKEEVMELSDSESSYRAMFS